MLNIKKIVTQYLLKEGLSLRLKAYFIIRKVVIGFILAIIVNFVVSYFFNTPKVFSLSRENSELVLKYRLLQNRIDKATYTLDNIRQRDNGIYRSIFAADSMEMIYLNSQSGTAARVGGFQPLVDGTQSSLERLSSLLYTQSISLDTLQMLAKDKEKMSLSVPTMWPMDRKLLRGHIGRYGRRVHPIFRYTHTHTGIDLAAPKNSSIYATASGKVTFSGWQSGYGINVVVDHGYGYKTRYAHLSKSEVAVGQELRRGEQLGLMGATGNTTGVHLHYEVIYRGHTVDPMIYLSMDMSNEEFEEIIQSVKDTTYE